MLMSVVYRTEKYLSTGSLHLESVALACDIFRLRDVRNLPMPVRHRPFFQLAVYRQKN